MKRIGVLALQGDFEAHRKALADAGAEAVEVRSGEQLRGLGGLVIPGGESTTMLKLIEQEGLLDPIREFGGRHPLFGTCAGAILLARDVLSHEQPALGLVDIGVERNAYGRQIQSCVARLAPVPEVNGSLGEGSIEAVFIRAPVIRRIGPHVRVLARYNGDPVLVEDDPHLVATFHPELSADRRVHRLFLEKIVSQG